MVNVLLNYYNFDGEWAKKHIEKYVVNRKVLIIPLAYRDFQCWDNESWQSVYGKGGEKYDSIIAPFWRTDIRKKNWNGLTTTITKTT